MVGLSDFGMYQRTLLTFETSWKATPEHAKYVKPTPHLTGVTACIAIDVQQKLWIARGSNWPLVRSDFMGAVSGEVRREQSDVVLAAPFGDVVLLSYYSNDAPRDFGRAVRGFKKNSATAYKYYVGWTRCDDPSIMTPIDRFAEMFHRAVYSQRLTALLRETFGGIIGPEALLMLSGTFFALFGAQYVGGRVAAVALGRLLQVHQFACNYMTYNEWLKAVYNATQNARTPKDLEFGTQMLTELLRQLIIDVASVLMISALTKAAAKLFSLFKALTPEKVKEVLSEAAAKAEKHIRTNGYNFHELLKEPTGVELEHAAREMYKDASLKNREILVVREPSALRGVWIAATEVWNRAKPMWMKMKSSAGWHGLVCLARAEVENVNTLQRSGTFDLNAFKGVSQEIDAAIAAVPNSRSVPKFRMPTDGRKLGLPEMGIDYSHTGKNNILLQGHYLVEISHEKFLIVDGTGAPYIPDLDVAMRQQPGNKTAGSHLSKPGQVVPEDDFVVEYHMNERYKAAGGHPTHDPSQHGGIGASIVYVLNAIKKGKSHWSPRLKDGTYQRERLVIFVPELDTHGRMSSNMYVLEGWGDFKTFAEANGLQFPF